TAPECLDVPGGVENSSLQVLHQHVVGNEGALILFRHLATSASRERPGWPSAGPLACGERRPPFVSSGSLRLPPPVGLPGIVLPPGCVRLWGRVQSCPFGRRGLPGPARPLPGRGLGRGLGLRTGSGCWWCGCYWCRCRGRLARQCR